jgi:immune inhibitor A
MSTPRCRHEGRCLIPPAPELRERLKEELDRLNEEADLVGAVMKVTEQKRPGLNDGLILPGDQFPIGTPLERVRSEAALRAPLRGAVRVVVVLVDFDDEPMNAAHDRQHYEDLFFSFGRLPTGSVREYFAEASRGMVDIQGEVVGPYRLPRTMAGYANNASGTGGRAPNARTMARDAAEAANPHVNFRPYDNDGSGYVDAFIVVHAGPGAEQTGNRNHIWSHKWVLSGGEYHADGTKIYAYLTVPEDARIGVCCHELGHLLFGWPDLYDTDGSSEGIGNWCLMAGGSWNGSGETPAHPSAWCKSEQGWVTVINQKTNANVVIPDVKDAHTVYRLWQQGAAGKEYFLVENRQRTRFDRLLPGEGLLIYHIDDAIATNEDERHPKVRLLQADGRDDLGRAANRGDAGDAFPGTSGNRAFTATSNPSSRAYGGRDTGVSVTDITQTGPAISARLAVGAVTALPRPLPRGFWRLLGFTPRRALAAAPRPREDAQLRALLRLLAAAEYDEAGDDAVPAGESGWAHAVDERLDRIENTLAALLEAQGLPAGHDGEQYE